MTANINNNDLDIVFPLCYASFASALFLLPQRRGQRTAQCDATSGTICGNRDNLTLSAVWPVSSTLPPVFYSLR